MLLLVLALVAALEPRGDHRRFAEAVTAVVDAEPALFKDDPSKEKTAALLVAIGYRESSFKLDAVGDGGKSVCAFQIFGGRRELLTQPEACARTAFAILRESMRVCPAHPLAVYAAGPGGCTSERAQRISRDRMALAKWALGKAGK